MLKVMKESNVADDIYSLLKQLKDIQQTLESFDVLPADVEDQIQIQNIRVRNAIGKMNDLIKSL